MSDDGFTRTLPATAYHDPVVYEQERRAIFGREWLWFAAESDLREAGCYVAREYAGHRVFVVRGRDGVLRGFHNVCRHRAGRLVEPGTGRCGNIVCGYHGWIYEFDGRLRVPRDFSPELPVDEAAFPLFPVRVDTIAGLVFINLGADPRPLADDLGPTFAELAEFDLTSMTCTHRVDHELACNWKTYADNYLEGYHIPFVHPELTRQIDTKQYRVVLGDRYARHEVPTRDGSVAAGKWIFRWPNLCLNVYRDSMNVEVIVPTGPQTCTVLYNFFFRDPHDPAHADVVAMSCAVMDEDKAICETVQPNLAAGIYERGVLSPRHENGLVQFHDLIRAATR